MLPLVAVSLVVFLGMTALAVDLGFLWQQQRQTQGAADAGALAGAQDLPKVLQGRHGSDGIGTGRFSSLAVGVAQLVSSWLWSRRSGVRVPSLTL